MAPALVELSTSKERNSSSKKYIKDFSCMSHLNIELVDKIRFAADPSPLFTCDIEQVKEGDNSCKVNQLSCQGMVSNESEKIPISNLNGNILSKLQNDERMKIEVYRDNNIKKTLGESTILKSRTESDCCVSNCSTALTRKDQSVQPCAEYKPSRRIAEILCSKETSIHKNFSHLHSNLTSLDNRLKRLSSKNITSHVASFVSKSKIREQCIKIEDNIGETPRILASKQLPLKYTYDLTSSLTDNEDELEHKQQIFFRTKKIKNLRYVFIAMNLIFL